MLAWLGLSLLGWHCVRLVTCVHIVHCLGTVHSPSRQKSHGFVLLVYLHLAEVFCYTWISVNFLSSSCFTDLKFKWCKVDSHSGIAKVPCMMYINMENKAMGLLAWQTLCMWLWYYQNTSSWYPSTHLIPLITLWDSPANSFSLFLLHISAICHILAFQVPIPSWHSFSSLKQCLTLFYEVKYKSIKHNNNGRLKG